MSLGAVLNSDVGSLREMAGRAVHWWLGQLAAMVPAALRPRRRGPRRLIVWEDGALRVVRTRGTGTKLPRAGARVLVAVPERLAFMRALRMPRMSAADIRRMVELEAERLSPLPPSEVLVAMDARPVDGAAGTAPIDVAVLPQRVAELAIASLDDAGLVLSGFVLLAEPGRGPRFDFMPALRSRGLVPSRRSPAAIWWSMAAMFAVLNVAVSVMRDRQSVAQLAAVVEQQAPAVAAARTIERRAMDFDAIARDLLAQRQAHDVLGTLAVVSRALPSGAWVQRFTASGPSVRLTGYKRRDVDLVAALRADPGLGGLRSNSAQLVGDTPAGQPFDLALQMRSGQ